VVLLFLQDERMANFVSYMTYYSIVLIILLLNCFTDAVPSAEIQSGKEVQYYVFVYGTKNIIRE